MNRLIHKSIVLISGLVILTACSKSNPVIPPAPVQSASSSTEDTNQESPESTFSTEIVPSSNGKITADLLHNGDLISLELYAKTDQYGNPLSWHLTVDGIEKLTLGPAEAGTYGAPADLKLDDLDGDNKPEVLIYRYSTGSGGAVGLSVYKPSDEWRELFAVENPFELADSQSLKRYEVKYLGDYRVRFIDHNHGLEAVILLDKKKYQDAELHISTWVDPISEYEIIDSDGDDIKEIKSIQRIIGTSHADTIGLIITTYSAENGEYRGKTISVHDEQGALIETVGLE